MQLATRRKAMAFFVVFGICLVALAVTLNVSWIILHWRQTVLLVLGVIFFAALILGMILNTAFLVREIRRGEQHDSFINGVTHELKTPIASIRLYLETLQRRDVDKAKRQEFYELMLADTDRLLATVDQVLKAGRAGHKTLRKHRVPVDFGAIVRECVELARARHHLAPGDMQFTETADGNAALVSGDPEDLRTAVANVLDNAIKYSGERIDVAVQVEVPGEKHVLLRVRDRGVGIPRDELKRIFKRFYRVHARTRSAVKGTGLGLFIVRSIAKSHGGRVFAESSGEGRGTTVTLELPRIAA
jgi:two-component system, OmpR family, sensor histidine kinase SenX3